MHFSFSMHRTTRGTGLRVSKGAHIEEWSIAWPSSMLSLRINLFPMVPIYQWIFRWGRAPYIRFGSSVWSAFVSKWRKANRARCFWCLWSIFVFCIDHVLLLMIYLLFTVIPWSGGRCTGMCWLRGDSLILRQSRWAALEYFFLIFVIIGSWDVWDVSEDVRLYVRITYKMEHL